MGTMVKIADRSITFQVNPIADRSIVLQVSLIADRSIVLQVNFMLNMIRTSKTNSISRQNGCLFLLEVYLEKV